MAFPAGFTWCKAYSDYGWWCGKKGADANPALTKCEGRAAKLETGKSATGANSAFVDGGSLFLVAGLGCAPCGGLGSGGFPFGIFTPEDEDVADVLDGNAVQGSANLGEQSLPVVPLDAV